MSHDRLINHTAEAALLGAMLLDNALIATLADRVSSADFGDPLHGRIHNAMLRFHAKDMPATAMTLRPVFAADEDAQYGDYLDQLVDAPAVVSAADGIADQVADLAARRVAREAMREATRALHEDLDKPVDEICGQVEAAGWAAAHRTKIDVALDPGELVGLVEARDDRIAEDPNSVGIVNSLLMDFDRGLGALEHGTYNVLAGRPGMGKSATASSLALGYAVSGHCGLYLQHEMTAEQMGLRSTADLSHAMGTPLGHGDLRRGGLNGQQRRELAAVRERAKLLPLRFICPGPVDVRRVWSLVAQQRAMWRARGRKLEFVVLDQLSWLRIKDGEGREITDPFRRMSAVSKDMKRLAKEMEVTLIALAQISRGVEGRVNKRPMISDLKESGSLEEDADSVTLLYREEYYLEQSRPKQGERDQRGANLLDEWEGEMSAARGKIDFIFAKNRHGRSSTRTGKFIGEFSAVRSGDFDPNADEPLLF